MQFPNAVHLRCFRHFKANIVRKLGELHVPTNTVDLYLEDIYGKTVGASHICGLVDCNDATEFREKL